MNYLLDTHALIWVLEDHKNLSANARKTIQDQSNAIFVSSVNLWEISLKVSIGKLVLTGVDVGQLPNLFDQMDFGFFPLTPEDAATYHDLQADYHRDPFDRMLIWQAIRNDFILITRDPYIKKYETDGLKTFW
ncbi:MAG: type II toxin-antitoxin system VapC family toxin [Cyclobacteriaceae bacterium]